jgi:hypothetical protein
MDKNQIIFASLVGSKVAESLPRFATVQNELSKRVLPVLPIPFFGTNTNSGTIAESTADYQYDRNWQADFGGGSQFFPLSFKRRGDGLIYKFPYEPMISISGGNSIATRKVAKAPNFIGTVKEHWCQDDYEITITGVAIGALETGSVEECYPIDQFQALKEFCTHPAGIQLYCEPLQLLGINNVVVKSFSFPFTKGENVQAYEIQCLSDFTSELLLEIE